MLQCAAQFYDGYLLREQAEKGEQWDTRAGPGSHVQNTFTTFLPGDTIKFYFLLLFTERTRGGFLQNIAGCRFRLAFLKVRYKRYIWGSRFRIFFLRPCVYPEPYLCRDGWTGSFICSLHTSKIATGCKFTASGLKPRLSTGGS